LTFLFGNDIILEILRVRCFIMRLTIGSLVKATGLCEATIRKYTDEGKIPHQRAESGWRIFTEESIERAKKLAGIENDGGLASQDGDASKLT
jgi:hypothetical protein